MVGVVLNIKENYHLYTPNSHFAKNGLVLRMLLIIKHKPMTRKEMVNPIQSSNITLFPSNNIFPTCGI